MKQSTRITLGAAVLGLAANGAMAADEDCLKISENVEQAVSAEPADLLEIVESKITANPGCACEVVKAAIESSDADAEQVAAIVETAASAAPEHMRLISQCAVAVAPDSLSEVQAVVARLDPGKGEVAYDAKSSKTPMPPVETKPAWNPLDFPGEGPVGPNPNSPGGLSELPPGPGEGYVPPVVNQPEGTETDFGSGLLNGNHPGYPF